MTDAEKGAFADQLHAALEDRRLGVNPIADEILREAEAFSEKRRTAARARWKGRQGGGDASACKCMQVHSVALPNIPTDRHTDRQDIPIRPTDARTRAKRADGAERDAPDGGKKTDPEPDPPRAAAMPPTATAEEREARWGELAAALEDSYALLAAIPDIDLAAFAAWACFEPRNHRAVAHYRGFVRKHGPESFRRLLDEFLGECSAPGGEPESRGRAFMARVRREEGNP